MANRPLFTKFTVVNELYDDEVFRYFCAYYEEDSNKSVVVALLKEKWLSNELLVGELIEHFELLQNLTRPELARVRGVFHDPDEGFGVAFELPGEKRLSQIVDVQSTVDPLNLIRTVCEGLHAAHVRHVYHGYLRADDIWITGDNSLKVAGFGYLAALRHGWHGDDVNLAPELLKGNAPDARTDIYSLARLLVDLYPKQAQLIPLRQALDPEPDRRPIKIREFGAALEAAWVKPKRGIRVKNPKREPWDPEESQHQEEQHCREEEEQGYREELRRQKGEYAKKPAREKPTPWKLLVTGFGYTFIALLTMGGIVSGDFGTALLFAAEALLFMFLATNAWGMRSYFPILNSPNKLKVAGMWVVLLFFGFVAFGIVSDAIHEAQSTSKSSAKSVSPLGSKSQRTTPEEHSQNPEQSSPASAEAPTEVNPLQEDLSQAPPSVEENGSIESEKPLEQADRQQAEEGQRKAEEARGLAEIKRQQEEASRQAEAEKLKRLEAEKALAEEKRRQAEEAQRKAEEERRQVELKLQEQQKALEAQEEARQQAEAERIKRIEAEKALEQAKRQQAKEAQRKAEEERRLAAHKLQEQQRARTAELLPGLYEVIRSTPVLQEPHEKAAVIMQLHPAMRVRIVGATGPYLLVKSTSDRPPGYIASKDVAPIQERRASTRLTEKQRREEEQEERWRAQEEERRQEEAERLAEQRRQQEEQQQRETQRQREEMMNQGTDILRQLLYQGLGR